MLCHAFRNKQTRTLKVDDVLEKFKSHQRLFKLAKEAFQRNRCQVIVTWVVVVEIYSFAAIEARLHLAHQRYTCRPPE